MKPGINLAVSIRRVHIPVLRALVFIGVLGCGACEWESIEAADDGVVEGSLPVTVIFDEAAHQGEQLAAQELREYLQRAVDEAVEIRGAGAAAGHASAIFVGAAAAITPPDDLPPDGFIITRKGSDIHLRGASPRGTLYAAYRYLWEAVGWRWLQPGDGGEVLTSMGDVAFPGQTIVDAPHFPIRGLVRPWSGVHRWYEKLGLNYGLLCVDWDLGDRVEGIRRADLAVELGEHGFSYFSPPDGRLCPHDPDSIQHAIATMRALIDRHPGFETFGFWPEDGYFPFCQCDECGPIDPRNTLDGRYLRLFNPVARAIHESHPDARIGLLAYNNYRRPPPEPKPYTANVLLAFAAPVLHAQVLGSPQYRAYVGAIQRWQELGVSDIWLYEYYHSGHDAKRFNMLLPRAIAREVRLLKRLGISGMMPQINNPPWRNWGVGVNYFVAARLLWDPDADVDELIDEYCRAAWGSGAADMADFVEAYERAGRLMFRLSQRPADCAPTDAARLCKLLGECGELLARAGEHEMPPAGRTWLTRWQTTVAAAAIFADALDNWREAEWALERNDGRAARRAYLQILDELDEVRQIAADAQRPEVFGFSGPLRMAMTARRRARAIDEIGLQVRTPRARLRLLPIRKNAQRGEDELVFYDREVGERTGTNKWGTEVVVSDGRVTDIQIRRGNAKIPEDGFVLSGHRGAGSQLWDIRQGDRVSVENIKNAQ